MFILKSCTRCHGDLGQDRDGELVCLQCGHELRPAERAALLARMERARTGLNGERKPAVALAG
jgi:hypothetical protein